MIFKKSYRLHFFIMMLTIGATSCATYYQLNYQFNQSFENGNLQAAYQLLEGNTKMSQGKDRMLYYLNLGSTAAVMGNYEESNKHLEEAYKIGEDYSRNYLNEAVSFLTNPKFVQYKPEDHELLLIHYYKAINFLKLAEYESALVECRRLNNKLNQINGKYKGENKFKRDAFIANLMGIIYEADQDYNNAFIAYRNAVEIYEEDYKSLFNLDVPDQLKQDVVRAAYLTGFDDEAQRFESKFGIKYQPIPIGHGQLVFFLNNGLGPVKAETSINFAIVEGSGGVLNFTNEAAGINIPFNNVNLNDEERKGLQDLRVFRLALPKYVERKEVFTSASLEWNDQTFQLQKAEDVNAIAFQSLNQRMLAEMSKSLLRLAVKKGLEAQVRKEDKDLGAIVGFINAATEMADTRNWQTIPHEIHYARLNLPPGEQKVTFHAKPSVGGFKSVKQDLKMPISAGATSFFTFSTLEHLPPANY